MYCAAPTVRSGLGLPVPALSALRKARVGFPGRDIALDANNKMCFLEGSFQLELASHSPHPCPADGLLDASIHVLQIAGGIANSH